MFSLTSLVESKAWSLSRELGATPGPGDSSEWLEGAGKVLVYLRSMRRPARSWVVVRPAPGRSQLLPCTGKIPGATRGVTAPTLTWLNRSSVQCWHGGSVLTLSHARLYSPPQTRDWLSTRSTTGSYPTWPTSVRGRTPPPREAGRWDINHFCFIHKFVVTILLQRTRRKNISL